MTGVAGPKSVFPMVLLACMALSGRTRAQAAAPAATLFVAPNGNDANAGTPEKPLASLAGARDAVRRLIAAGTRGEVKVLFRSGVYALAAPVLFGPDDSAEGLSVTYAAAPGQKPVFSGGRRITNWQKDGRLWKAQLPEAAGGKWPFRHLTVNGLRRTLARTPNAGEYFRIVDGGDGDAKTSFEFRPGDIRNGPRVKEADAVVFVNWETGMLPIAAVNEEECQVTFAGPMKWAFEHNQRYYVENLREALDAPGEWWLDREAGTLLYYPLPGEEMAKAEVVAPVTTQFLRIEGDAKAEKPVRRLRFEGLAFRHTDFALEPTGHVDWQAAQSVPASVLLTTAEECAFEGCEFTNLAGYALEVGPGCAGNRIVRNEIRDLGAGGIIARGGSSRTTIHNNFIHDGSAVWCGALPVLVQNSGDNEVTHNEVCDFNYSGMSIGWSWGFQPTNAHNNKVEYNHIHHVGRGVMTDLGGIYTLGISTGTTIRYNLIHHVWDWPEGYLGSGIYPDEGTSGALIENNVVYATSHGGLHVHYGRDNIVRNNIFAFGRDAQVQMGRMRSASEKGKKNWLDYPGSSMTLERNIVLFERGDLFRRDSELKADHNLYWNTAGEPLKFVNGVDFAAWQAKGMDTHSLIADPGFVNAKAFDFRLKPGSPALKLGFQPIDISTAGLVGDAEWVNRPRKIRRPADSVPERAAGPTSAGIEDGFETTRPGRHARVARVYGESGQANIRVTDEAAAAGKRSLKFTDAAGMANGYDPHMCYMLNAAQGTARSTFDLRLEPGSHGYCEWRDWSVEPYITGPSLTFLPDGSLQVNKQTLLTLPHAQWIRFEIACPLGEAAKGTWDLTVTVPGKKPERFAGLACKPEFRKITWVGYSSLATDAQVFFLDNLKLSWK